MDNAENGRAGDPMLEKLLGSRKYQDVCPDTIRRVWADCRARYKKPRDAERAARTALHGITGAFLTPEEAARCRRAMARWAADRGDADLEAMLACHASTRERLPLSHTDALFGELFSRAGAPATVLDLACGLNPIYLAARGVRAVGLDISGQAVGIVNGFAETAGVPASARCADLLCAGAIPEERFDAALLLKVLPLLERQRAGSAMAVMVRVSARALVVSFPTRTLGGRDVGMARHYSEWMAVHVPENRAIAFRLEAENELFYVLEERRA